MISIIQKFALSVYEMMKQGLILFWSESFYVAHNIIYIIPIREDIDKKKSTYWFRSSGLNHRVLSRHFTRPNGVGGAL